MDQQIIAIKLTNSNGLELQVSNFGANIISLMVPDKNKEFVNVVVVGLESAEDYTKQYYLEVDEQLIPSGKLINSMNTRFDRNKISLLGR